jgi:membrane-bound metal-dependent hydrolase YbcI (DUF457 family)
MLLFAHTGITVGAVWLAGKVAPQVSYLVRKKTGSGETAGTETPPRKAQQFIDYRLLLVGSMLPDILDKPLGLWLLSEDLSNGRIYGHTMLMLVLLGIFGAGLYALRRTTALLVVTLGTFFHLLLDQMWSNPRTLFWPFLGLDFGKIQPENWLSNLIEALTTRPEVYIPEIAGLIMLGIFVWPLVRRSRLIDFLKTGRAG